MKKIIFTTATLLTTLCYAQSNLPADKGTKQTSQNVLDNNTLLPIKFISRAEAEKILGQPVHLKDSLRKEVDGYLRFQFTYKANSKDSLKGTVSSLFFGLERYQQTALAKRTYDILKAEQAKNYVVTDLTGIGDEAIMTKDQYNDPFIMIRKDDKIFKFRSLYVTGKSSLDDLKLLAKKIVSAH